MLNELIALLFPEVCLACQNALYNQEKYICTICHFKLPKTNFHLTKENPVSKLFWGRVAIETATSFLYYNKSSSVQKLIHQLKYKGQEDLGIYLGELYGLELKKSPFYAHADLIIPIPLHKNKLRRRGYNQSDALAQGLSQSMEIKWKNDVLERTVHNETQTNKGRYERWQNVESIFRLKQAEKLQNKQVILVDDVITTGSTLESAANLLYENEIKISVVSLACALRL